MKIMHDLHFFDTAVVDMTVVDTAVPGMTLPDTRACCHMFPAKKRTVEAPRRSPVKNRLFRVLLHAPLVVAVSIALFLGATPLYSQELTVLIEEDVYPNPAPDNGSGATWCHGSTVLARAGDDVFVTELFVIPNAKPLNNCSWKLLKRDAGGWRCLFADDENRTREPSPVAVYPGKNEIFVSTNPTIVADPEKYSGPAQPQIVRFGTGNGAAEKKVLLPAWDGEPPFTEHSYRSFVADGTNGELVVFQNVEYSHAEWAFLDRAGNWSSQGKIAWPWEENYDKPGPVRVCYPTVAMANRKVFFCGVSDILEPNPQWMAFKKELTGQNWDYDFRRLFFTWTNDITKEEFQPWIEISSREKTCGWIMPCDLYVAPDESIHVLWSEKAIDVRLREKFFPGEKQYEALCHAVVRDGKVVKRNNVMIRHEGEDKPVASTGRFHATPDGRLWVVYYVRGTERNTGTGTERTVSENRIVEIKNGEPAGSFQTIPLEKPFSTFFTASVRAGNVPSPILDLHGNCPNSKQLRYAAIRFQ